MHSNSGDVIEIQGVTRAFGSMVALRNVSLSVAPGSVLGLVGENGAGDEDMGLGHGGSWFSGRR